MGPMLILVLPPLAEFRSGVIKRMEPVLIETFDPLLAVATLDKETQNRLSSLDQFEIHVKPASR